MDVTWYDDNRVGGHLAFHLQSMVSGTKISDEGIEGSGQLGDHLACNLVHMMSTWQDKKPENWDNSDILDWIYFTAGLNDIQLSALRGENFQGLTGREFCRMTRDDFIERDSEFGESLYNSFISLVKKRYGSISSDASLNSQITSFLYPEQFHAHFKKNDVHVPSNLSGEDLYWAEFPISRLIPATVQFSEIQDFSDEEASDNKRKPISRYAVGQSNKTRRRRLDASSRDFSCGDIATREISHEQLNIGKRKHSSKILLSDFMRDLLEKPEYNPSCVRWEDKEKGIFRIVSGKSKLVAELWGKIKNNPKMTFEKMGRSLRWCRDNNGNFSTIPKDGSLPKSFVSGYPRKTNLVQSTHSRYGNLLNSRIQFLDQKFQ